MSNPRNHTLQAGNLWPEIRPAASQETQTPVLGRILNSVSRGYAVGLGGVVGFLPMSQCLVRTAQRVGVLQPFMVSAVERKMGMRGTLQPNVVVIDAEKLREVRPSRRCEAVVPLVPCVYRRRHRHLACRCR